MSSRLETLPTKMQVTYLCIDIISIVISITSLQVSTAQRYILMRPKHPSNSFTVAPTYKSAFLIPSANTLMLCLVGVNDSGRNGMKNELSYGQFLRNFIPSSIPFLTSCARYHTFNLRWNAPFSPILNFFSNLIIAILHFLKFFSKLSSYLYQFQVFLLISFHSILPNQTQHNSDDMIRPIFVECNLFSTLFF